jgi:hypothetical protein
MAAIRPIDVPMRRLLLAIATLLALLVAGAASAQPQTRFGLSPEAYSVYQRWVLAMCIGGDERALAADLARHAAELVPALERAITEGPTRAEAQQVREAAQMLFERRSKFPLAEAEVTGVSRADLARFQRQSREAFVDDQVKRFIAGYRSNAVAALGTIGSARARLLLTRIARNARDPLAPAAREALRSIAQPR